MRRLLVISMLSLAHAQPSAVALDPSQAAALGAPVQAGDLRACTGEICVVVAARQHPGVGAPTGGHVIWVGGRERLPMGSIYPVLDEAGLRTPRFAKVFIAQPGSPTLPAIIRAEGANPIDDQVELVVDYVLEPGSAVVRIVASAANRGRGHYARFSLGHFVGWGLLQAFAPESGTAVTGRQTRSEWVGADHPAGALVLALHSGRLASVHGQHWSVLSSNATHLKPGDRVTRELEIYVRPGAGLASAVDGLRAARRSVSGRVEGVVRDGKAKALAAQVTAYDARGRPVQRAVSRDGAYGITLHPGEYQLVARAQGHAAGPPLRARINGDEVRKLDLKLGPVGHLRVTFEDGDGPVPAWIRVSTDHTRQVFRAVDGRLDAPLPPGRYTVVAGAGPQHEVVRKTVVVAGQTTLALELPRAFSADGWFAFDPTVGVEVGVATPDTAGAQPDYCATNGIAASALLRPPGGARVAGSGYEVLAPDQGRFMGWPADATLPLLGREANADVHLATLRALSPETLVGVLAPRAAGVGYFAKYQFDPATPALPRGGFSLDFNLLDVGGYDRKVALADYLGLLARGKAVVPLAGSSARSSTHLCGAAFMWLAGAPESIHGAVARNVAVASNGPLVELSVNGAPVGEPAPRAAQNVALVRVRAAKWTRTTSLRVYADGDRVASLATSGTDSSHRVVLPAGTRWVVAEVAGRTDLSPITGRLGAAFAVTSPVRLGPAEVPIPSVEGRP